MRASTRSWRVLEQGAQRRGLVAQRGQGGEAVTIGACQLAEHSGVEAVALSACGTKAIAGGLDLVWVHRQHRLAGAEQPADQQTVGLFDRHGGDVVIDQRVDQRRDSGFVGRQALLQHDFAAERVGDADVVVVLGPIKAAGCGHRWFSLDLGFLTQTDQEVPSRVLIDRPSMGRRPVAAEGASDHHRETQVSHGPLHRQARQAFSRRWSSPHGEHGHQVGSRPDPISLSPTKREVAL